MPDRPRTSVFLERRAYRVRRMTDAARLLPVLGAIVMLVPILWPAGTRTWSALLYIFGAWTCLILAVALLGRRVERDGVERVER